MSCRLSPGGQLAARTPSPAGCRSLCSSRTPGTHASVSSVFKGTGVRASPVHSPDDGGSDRAILAYDPHYADHNHRFSETEGPLNPGAPEGIGYLCPSLPHQKWHNSFAHTVPKSVRCIRAALRVGETARSTSHTHTIPVVAESPHYETRGWCVVQELLDRDGNGRPSPVIPSLFPPGSPQHLSTPYLPPQHLPAEPHETSGRSSAENPQNLRSNYYQAKFPCTSTIVAALVLPARRMRL